MRLVPAGALALGLATLLDAATPASNAPVRLPEQIVTATRTPQPPALVAPTVHTLDGEALAETPALTLDGLLRSVPAFTLFRRSDSLVANPTAQGVSLRGLGPSGASRSLVLLDGVPLNDPFGGWVAWTKVPRQALSRVEIVPGGGATAWGNAALGGVIQVLSDLPHQRATRFNATIGDFGTRSLEFAHTEPRGPAKLELAARVFATEGFSLVAPERRGPIDIAAWSRHRWLSARWRHDFGRDLAFTATARGYEEKRGNGTPYQRNGTREKFFSAALAGQPADRFGWEAVVYGQDQSFASTFSGVNATRTVETPASDQFAVPALALGGAWTGTWQHVEGRTSAGADARLVRGETRENFTFAAGNFTRQRVAGGRQAMFGAFALHQHPLTRDLRATLGVRVDGWRDTDGHRWEIDRVTGAASRNDRYADTDGTQLSPSAGFVWLSPLAWRVRGNAQHAFRRPTLNELYRPFRVGANVTEANAALRTEEVTSAELGAEWSLLHWSKPPPPPAPRVAPDGTTIIPLQASHDVAPRKTLTLGATAFWNQLDDAVGNVTIARGPGTFPIVGVLAAGALGRQRLNLDRIRVQGLELSGRWMPSSAITITGDFLVNEATVQRARVSPALVGKRVAQVPRRSGSIGGMVRAGGFSFAPRVRYLGRQFEDDENQLVLGAGVIADLSISRPLSPNLEVFLTGENLGNARLETGRSADGIVNIGTPRLVVGGLRGRW